MTDVDPRFGTLLISQNTIGVNGTVYDYISEGSSSFCDVSLWPSDEIS